MQAGRTENGLDATADVIDNETGGMGAALCRRVRPWHPPVN